MRYIFLIFLTGFAALFLVNCKGGSSVDTEAMRRDSIAKAQEEARIADSIAKEEARAEAERAELRKQKAKADSAEIAQLMPDFSCIDNAENKDSKLYVVKGTSTKHNRNAVYMSFILFDNKPRDLVLNVEYFGNDWINLTNAVITIDDESFDLSPNEDVGDNVNDNAMCSEWFQADCPHNFTEKLETAQKGSVKLIGKDGSKSLTLSKKDIENMAKTVKLYNLL